MSWNKLAPIAKTNGRPMASASIVINKDQIPKISLILSASLKDEFGDPKKADVLAGDGEHADCLLLEFRPDGAFELKNFVHGGARIFLPVPEGLPRRAVANAPCSLGAKVGGAGGQTPLAEGVWPSVVIKLPVAEWTRCAPALAARAPAAAPPPCRADAQGGQRRCAGRRRLSDRQGSEDCPAGRRALHAQRRNCDDGRRAQRGEPASGRGRADATHARSGALR